MSYATLEEAWGPNFNTKKKKSRKEKKLEAQEQKMFIQQQNISCLRSMKVP